MEKIIDSSTLVRPRGVRAGGDVERDDGVDHGGVRAGGGGRVEGGEGARA